MTDRPRFIPVTRLTNPRTLVWIGVEAITRMIPDTPHQTRLYLCDEHDVLAIQETPEEIMRRTGAALADPQVRPHAAGGQAVTDDDLAERVHAIELELESMRAQLALVTDRLGGPEAEESLARTAEAVKDSVLSWFGPNKTDCEPEPPPVQPPFRWFNAKPSRPTDVVK